MVWRVFIFYLVSLLCTGCMFKEGTIQVNINRKALAPKSISSISVINHQIKISGTSLSGVTSLRIKNSYLDENFIIESASSTEIIANATKAISIGLGQTFDLILNSAEGSATFPVSFTIANGSITANMLSTSGGNSGEILKFNGTSWVYVPLSSSQLYVGGWDANADSPTLVGQALPSAGDYYIVTVAGSKNLGNGVVVYSVGDIIISNGSSWDLIAGAGNSVNKMGDTMTGVLTLDSDLKIKSSANTNYVTIKSPALAASYNLTLPAAAGTNGYVLSTNGSGVTSWVAQSAGGVGTVTNVSGTLPISVVNSASSPVISISQANTSSNGYLSSADWNIFNGKQAALPGGGTNLQYYRGDNSWQTLNTNTVPDVGMTNLYFTNARALGVTLSGLIPTNSSIVATDSVLVGFNKSQGQIDAINMASGNYLIKNGVDTLSGTVSLTNVITATATGDIVVNSIPLMLTSAVNKIYVDTANGLKLTKTGDTMSGVLTLDNDLKIKGGANYVTLRSHVTTANYDLILPSTAGTAGFFLQTDGAGNLSWINPSTVSAGTGTVTSASIVDGVIINADINANAAIDATKINTGIIDNTEFNYLDGVTSAIQTQLNNKALKGANSDITSLSGLTTALSITQGGTGATTAALARTALGLGSASTGITGSSSTNIPTLGTGGIVGTNLCSGDNSGSIVCTAMTSSIVAGTISDKSGTGALLFGTAPTISSPIITNIAPGANFTLTQNSVVPFTSENTGAVSNTLYLKSGNVGIGTTTPALPLHIVSGTQNTLIQIDGVAQSFVRSSIGGVTKGYVGYISQGTNGMGFLDSTGSYARLLVTDTGNVGIGTTTPESFLNIGSTGSGQQFSIRGLSSRDYSLELSNNGNGVSIISQNGYTESSGAWPSAVFKYTRTYSSGNSVGARGIMYGFPSTDSISFFNEVSGTATTTGSTFTPSVKMVISGAGNIGIGSSSPGYKLDVAGDINSSTALRFGGTSVCTSSGCTAVSDRTLKKNIKPLVNSFEKILKLQGVDYEWKDKYKYGINKQIGLIAQDLEKIYPEVVITDKKTGLKSVAYGHLIAPMTEAFKELNKRYTATLSDFKAVVTRVMNLEIKDAEKSRAINSLRLEKADLLQFKKLELEIQVLREENSGMKTYLCSKDPMAVFCKNK